MKAQIPKHWLSLTGMIAVLAGGLGMVASPVLDQVIRNRVDEHMYGYALRELLPTGIDEYEAMPVHWRQVISELSIRRKIVGDSESRVLFATLEHFDVNNLDLVDKVVPYMMADFIARDPNQKDTQHPIPNAVWADFLDLETLGVLQSVNDGSRIRRNIRAGSYVIESGSHTVTIRPSSGGTNLEFRTTRISAPWVKLIELLRVPTDEKYLDWFTSRIRESGFEVQWTKKNEE